MNATLIETMIQQAQRAELEIAEKREQELREQIEELNNCIRDAMGGLWDELLPYKQPGKYSESPRGRVELIVEFRPIELELAPLFVSISSDNRTPKFFRRHHDTQDNLGAKLKECRDVFPEWHANWLEQQINPLRCKLYSYSGPDSGRDRCRTTEEADQVLEQLLEIDPGAAETWHRMRAEWQMYFDNWHARHKAKEEREKAIEKAEESYRAAYRSYFAEHQHALATNNLVVEDLQDDLNQSIVLYRLTYSVIATDDNWDERIIETNHVFVVDETPDTDGAWLRLKNGEILPIRYFNPVSVEAVVVQALDQNPAYCKSIYIEQAAMRIWYCPLATPDAPSKIEALQEKFVPLPEAPSYDYDLLSSHVIDRIQREIAPCER